MAGWGTPWPEIAGPGLAALALLITWAVSQGFDQRCVAYEFEVDSRALRLTEFLPNTAAYTVLVPWQDAPRLDGTRLVWEGGERHLAGFDPEPDLEAWLLLAGDLADPRPTTRNIFEVEASQVQRFLGSMVEGEGDPVEPQFATRFAFAGFIGVGFTLMAAGGVADAGGAAGADLTLTLCHLGLGIAAFWVTNRLPMRDGLSQAIGPHLVAAAYSLLILALAGATPANPPVSNLFLFAHGIGLVTSVVSALWSARSP